MGKEFPTTSMLLPSGAAREKASVAMTVPPPGRFSMTTETPRSRPTCSPRIRAQISAVPPAGNGLTSLIVRPLCASAGAASASSMKPAAANKFLIALMAPSHIPCLLRSSLGGLAEQFHDPLRRDRRLGDAHPERLERILHRRYQGRDRGNCAALARSLEAERVERARRLHVQHLDVGRVGRERQQI